MDVRERPVDEEVAALRRALYRPDPPEGAVAAYLDAVGRTAAQPRAVEAAPAPAEHPRRRGRTRLLIAAAVIGVLLPLALVVRDAPAARSTAGPAASRAADDRYPPVPGEVLGVLSGGPMTSRAFDAGGRPVVVSVFCDRSGTLTLRIAADPAAVLTCQVGSPALAMVPSHSSEELFPVSITPDGPVRWTATIGALDPAQ